MLQSALIQDALGVRVWLRKFKLQGSVGLVPSAFSVASGTPSPSASISYGFCLPSPSVSGGVNPPFAANGIPLASTPPSTLPSPLASKPPVSKTSDNPSPSLSKSKLLGMPSPSVSHVIEAGVHAAFSTVSKIPSLSSSKSISSGIPSLSESLITVMSNGEDAVTVPSVMVTEIVGTLPP